MKSSGVIDSLSQAIGKLYDEAEKPADPIEFIRMAMCESCPTEEQYETLHTQQIETQGKLKYLEGAVQELIGSIDAQPSEHQLELVLDVGVKYLEDDDKCESLLKTFLTRDIYERLKTVKTSHGSNLLNCIQSGLANHDSGCGIYAPDAEAYTVFGLLFNPIIEKYHGGFGEDATHPAMDWGEPCCFPDLDPDRCYINSTRVRCGRSVQGFPFNPRMSREDYERLETEVKAIVEAFEDEELVGKYYSLAEMEPETLQQLIDEHILFKEGDRFLQAANANCFWPTGRGIFINNDKTFAIWCGEEDHLRIISMEPGGDLSHIYGRMIKGVEKLGEKLQFERDDRLGFLTFCPTNLGTTIRASVHIKLPKLAADRTKLEETANKYNLQVRGTAGEHSDGEDGVYDISNRRRLGLTEYDAVSEMYKGIKEIIEIEKGME